MYSEKVMEHFRHPHNMGEIENPDAQGEVGNPVCGDMMKVTMKINPETKIIEDIKFKTFGCVSAIACSSVTTDMLKGKTIDDAKKLTKQDIVNELGELPAVKLHCSILSNEAIQKAIEEYEDKLKANG
ncbi:MAG: iron-sulfur cluster assembly scaffold protein [Candidatus Woesearchaeota archaeon]